MRRAAAFLVLIIGVEAASASEDAGTRLGRIFGDEAGHWEGECVMRTPNGVQTQAAVFDIVSDRPGAHRYRGRYGDAAIAGRSEIEGGTRIDTPEGGGAPTRAQILSARRTAPDDYGYMLRDEAGRTTVTRLGPRQLLVFAPHETPDRPARICTYLRTGPASR